MTQEMKKKVIVSLTSFPARIDKVWMVVETMFRQTCKPNKIILWLSREQFPTEDSIPKMLLNQRERRLEICLVDRDMRSHNKYYYAMQKHPDDIIITIDDDIFYSPLLIESLLISYNEFPNNSLATMCKRIQEKDGIISKYRDWEVVHMPCAHKLNLGLGVGGILYPPNILCKEFMNQSVFVDKCLYADDVWLYFMTRLAEKECRKINFPIQTPLPILIRGNIKLSTVNVGEDRNDVHIRNVYEYYGDGLKKVLFKI